MVHRPLGPGRGRFRPVRPSGGKPHSGSQYPWFRFYGVVPRPLPRGVFSWSRRGKPRCSGRRWPGKSWCLDSISRSTSATSGIISSVAPPACCSACSSRPLSVPAERRLPSLPYHEPCDLLRSATVRILSRRYLGGQDPDRPPTPGGTRRRNRLLSVTTATTDPRETQTILRDRRTGAAVLLKFSLRKQAAAKFSAALS